MQNGESNQIVSFNGIVIPMWIINIYKMLFYWYSSFVVKQINSKSYGILITKEYNTEEEKYQFGTKEIRAELLGFFLFSY